MSEERMREEFEAWAVSEGYAMGCMIYGDRRIAELNCDWENGDKVLHFTAAPQPAEQKTHTHWSHDNPGLADQYRAEALVARRSLGFEQDACDVAPADIAEAIESLTQPAEQQPISHDWDDQDKCRRCGDRDWYASATCTPKKQPAPDVAGLVEALDCILSMDDEINIVDVMDPKAREMVEIARDALAAYRKEGDV